MPGVGAPGEIPNATKMQASFEIFQKVAETWPARNGKPAGSRRLLILSDRSLPPKHRISKNLSFRVDDDDDVAQRIFREDCEGREVVIGVRDIMASKAAPLLIGEVLGYADELSKPTTKPKA